MISIYIYIYIVVEDFITRWIDRVDLHHYGNVRCIWSLNSLIVVVHGLHALDDRAPEKRLSHFYWIDE